MPAAKCRFLLSKVKDRQSYGAEAALTNANNRGAQS